VLDVAFLELPGRAQEQVLTNNRRFGVHQGHRILQLVAKPERAPRLVEPAACPEAGGDRLIEEPPIRQRVERTTREVRQAIQSRAWPFATSVEGEHLRLRPFFWADLDRIDEWQGSYTPFDDPWLIPAPGSYERHEWFSHYLQTPVARLYAIENCDGALIGHLSLREIVVGSQARLGIGLAPGETGKGYGTEALKTFLPYYFNVLGFQRMVLDVAATNQRAIHSYEKVGFEKYSEHYRETADDSHWRILNQPPYVKLKVFFRRSPWGLQQLHYDMEITRQAWAALVQTAQ
jgi:RimJ/RimL family protein N-acetyltransferase